VEAGRSAISELHKSFGTAINLPLHGGSKFGNVRADLRRPRAHCMRGASFCGWLEAGLHNTGDFP